MQKLYYLNLYLILTWYLLQRNMFSFLKYMHLHFVFSDKKYTCGCAMPKIKSILIENIIDWTWDNMSYVYCWFNISIFKICILYVEKSKKNHLLYLIKIHPFSPIKNYFHRSNNLEIFSPFNRITVIRS